MKAFVITHPEMGVYLGNFLGLGFWSKLDPVGQPAAVTFATEAMAEDHMALWDCGRPQGAKLIPVWADLHNFASIDACVAAGLEGWQP